MWPQIPVDVNSLSAAALRSLGREIKAVALAKLADTALSVEDGAEVASFLAKRDEFIALAKAKDASAAQAAALSADDSDDEPEVVEVVEVEAAVEVVEVVEVDAEPELVAKTPAKVRTSFGQTGGTAVAVLEPPKIMDLLKATDNVPGRKAGEGFESWGELATALVRRSEDIRSNSSEKFTVASIKANYPEHRKLSDNVNFNMSKFDREEITAAFVAPATPYYGLACMNTDRRPVFNSLPGFEAPRMQVSIMPSPSLADIVTAANTAGGAGGPGGYAQWVDTDDDNAARTKTCITITAGSPTTYKMYGVWKCMTVKNMLAMSYPELVEAWLNRLNAAHARLGDTLLLNAMSTGCTSITAPALGYGGTTTMTSTILNFIALYQESQRWDTANEVQEGWLPRWVLWGIKMDVMRRRKVDSSPATVPSDEEIHGLFMNVGVNIHWFIDTPSWAVAIPGVSSASKLNLLPQTVQLLVAPRGKFALMDKGELSIGVTGNGLYRDNTSNSKNQFTFFFENFEGVVNTTSCPAYIIDIPVCWSGVQIDDIVINCQGGDEAGYQS